MPSVIIKEYQKHQIISFVNNSGDCIFKNLNIAYYELSKSFIRQLRRATGIEAPMANIIVGKNIVVKGDTLIEFKGCAISAISGNALRITSGEPT